MKKVLPSLFIFIVGLMIIQCSSKTDQEFYDSAKKLINDNKYDLALKEFEELLSTYPQSKIAAKANFEIGKIYHGKLINTVSEEESSKRALEFYKKVADNFSDSEEAPNSLFMVGFIQANELNQLEGAKSAYNSFLQKYPEHELVPSAKAELENLGVTPEEILRKNISEK